jgi:hypothetical protein
VASFGQKRIEMLRFLELSHLILTETNEDHRSRKQRFEELEGFPWGHQGVRGGSRITGVRMGGGLREVSSRLCGF